jgi:hypothetical protein
MLCCLLWALAAAVQPKALLIADNPLLVVLRRRMPRPCVEDADGRFVSVVQRLANHSPDRKAAKAVAPSGLADVLAPGAGAPSTHQEPTNPPYRHRATSVPFVR